MKARTIERSPTILQKLPQSHSDPNICAIPIGPLKFLDGSISPENIFPKALIFKKTIPNAFWVPIITDSLKLNFLWEKVRGSGNTFMPIVASLEISTTLSIRLLFLLIVTCIIELLFSSSIVFNSYKSMMKVSSTFMILSPFVSPAFSALL